VEVYTIGFTRRSAAAFFGALREAGIRRLVDVRLHNSSQLAGFAKRDDLAYFLGELCGAEYRHEPLLAPAEEQFDAYKRRGDLEWDAFARAYLALLAERRVEDRLSPDLFAIPTVLLCSEPTAERCHRRLALDYLASHWGNVRAVHL
jgi:uncharacterized protein (DUF488 family)